MEKQLVSHACLPRKAKTSVKTGPKCMSFDGVLDQNKNRISNNETHFVSPMTGGQYFIKKSSGVSELSFFKFLIANGY